MLLNLGVTALQLPDLGGSRHVLAYFVPDRGTFDQIKDALAAVLRVVRLCVPLTRASAPRRRHDTEKQLQAQRE